MGHERVKRRVLRKRRSVEGSRRMTGYPLRISQRQWRSATIGYGETCARADTTRGRVSDTQCRAGNRETRRHEARYHYLDIGRRA